VWVLLVAAVVVVVVLVAGITARSSRRRFRQRDGAVFRCRLRAGDYPSAIWPHLAHRWSRRMFAVWKDDVLIVRRGPVYGRIIPLHAQVSTAGVHAHPIPPPRRCGPDPISMVLRLWDGSCVEVATAGQDRLSLVGPFMAAAINDLPQSPAPKRRT
jgi:hypothetical protein